MDDWRETLLAQLQEQHGAILQQLEQQRVQLLDAVDRRCRREGPVGAPAEEEEDQQRSFDADIDEVIDDSDVQLGYAVASRELKLTPGDAEEGNLEEAHSVGDLSESAVAQEMLPELMSQRSLLSETTAVVSMKDGPRMCLRNLVSSRYFEFVSLAVIFLQVIWLVSQAQMFSHDLRCDIDPNCTVHRRVKNDPAVRVMDVTFMLIYTTEAILRLLGNWRVAIASWWWWFDLVLVAMGWPVTFVQFGIPLGAVRTVRVCRVLRFANERALPELETFCFLLRSVHRCMRAAVWSFVVLLLITTTAGLFIEGLVESRMRGMKDTSIPLHVREQAFLYFGSFSRTLLTMFEVTIGNWVPVCRFMVENLSQWWTLFFILYQCMFCFAVVRVMAAIFIAETNRLAAMDEQEATCKAERQRRVFLEKLRHMFTQLDTSGDGKISWSEFEALLTEPKFRTWMSTLEIPVDDLKTIFTMLDASGSGVIDFAAFTSGIMRFRGQAKSIDLVHVQMVVGSLDTQLSLLLHRLTNIEARLLKSVGEPDTVA